ncbi:Siroheme synthase / Precorrin-2 oxidase / Sirohydrochlorin ferrochelatase [hydrothermal vent metagenome]|uniref:precorrin-2 dehydrogenase n=1 Tax=hydrothermal vent metagenome TaxID=652676 RepID=A0A1W1BV91_9ZZZZ
MSFFPMYMDISNLKVLLVGGGNIATEKIEKLLDFTENIKIIAPFISEPLREIIKDKNLSYNLRPYMTGDINGFDIVIIATDTIKIHKEIYEESRGGRIWVNSVDNKDYCDFIFPSYIKRGDLTISFSTSGSSPAFTKQIKNYFERKIPENIDEFLDNMKTLRGEIPKGRDRMKTFKKMVKEYMNKNFS